MPLAVVVNALSAVLGVGPLSPVIPALAQSTYAQRVIADSPVSYWRLNDTGSTAVDQMGANNGGVSGGVTEGQRGPIADGGAMSFDGTSGWVNLGNSSTLQPQNWSIEAWMNATSESQACCENAGRIYRARHDGQWLDANASGTINGAECVSGGCPSTVSVASPSNGYLDGRWHYVVLTLDSTAMHLYVDGSQVTSATAGGTTGYSVDGIALARDGSCGCSYYAGLLSEVAFYNYPLTATQVSSHFAASGHSAPTGGVVPPTEHSAGASPSAPNAQESQGCYCEPINTAYGNFWHTADDLSVPGRGVPLQLTRTYSSVNAPNNGPLGYGWTSSYTMSLSADPVTGNVTIREENGGQVSFTLANGVYSAPPRDIATLVKNLDGSYTFTRDARQKYTFNASGQWTAVTDLNGYTTSLAYNGSGQLATVTDPANRALTFTWTGANLTSVSDPIGRQVSYAYNDGLGNLTDVTDANGGLTHFTYDSSHHLLTMTDPLGQITTNVYDTSSRVTSQTVTVVANDRTKDRTTTFAYTGDNSSASGGTVTITDPKGNVTVEQYQNGERMVVTKGNGTAQAATWSYTYDPATLGVATVVDPNGHVTQMSYDSSGNELTSTDALNRTTTNTYDSLNDLTSSKDPNQVTTTYVYDAAGNLQSRSTPLVGSSPLQSSTTTYTYGDSTHPGDVTSMTDPDNKVWATSYDTNGDLASTTDPLGDVTTYQYNAVGWRTATVSPRGNVSGCNCAAQHTTTYDYTDLRTTHLNGFGDIGTVTDPLGHTTQTTYDAARDVIASQDGDGNRTNYTYDLAREQTSVQRPDQATLRTDFNPDGTILDQVDGAGNTTSYGYDALARVTSTTDPLQRGTSFTYDGVGNQLTLVDAQSQTTTYAYDSANQLTAISYNDGHTPNVTNITYDSDGHRTAMTDGTGTSSWVWDSLHRMTSSTNGAGQTVGYGYDLKGQLTSITYPGSHVVQRGYDDAGRLTSVSDWLGHTTTFTPDPDSNVTAEVYPNGTTATTGYDNADRPTSISDAPTSAPSSPFASFGYTRDANEQVGSVTSAGVPADTHSYTYTALNQLHTVDTQSYGYSTADNVVQLGNGTQLAYDAASQLTTTAPAAISLVGTGSGGDTGSSKSVTVTLPSGIQANDQIFVATTQQSGKTVNTPTGYTQVASVTSTGSPAANTVLYRKTAAGGETSVTVSYGNKFAKSIVAVVYRGADPSNPIDVQTSATAAATTSVTTPSVTTTVAGDRMAFFGGAVGNGTGTSWTAPTGMTSRVQFAGNASTAAGVFDQVLGAPGATGTRTATLGVSAQLTGVALALRAPATTYAYNARGDRTSVTPPGGTATTLTYDQANRLTAYGTTATYTYDGDGLRQSKTVSGTTDAFTWDAAEGTPGVLVDATSASTTYFVYDSGGIPIEQISSSGAVDFYYHDQLANTRVLADTSGTVVGTFTYDAFGKQTGRTGTVTTPLGFAGQYTDVESGLQYLQARYYDPASGQFVTRDPLVAKTRLPYAYVHGDPLNATDPSGLYDYQDTEQIGTVKATGGAWAVMAYMQSHMSQVFPFSTGSCSQVQLGATCDLTPFPFLHDPVTVSEVGCSDFTFTTTSASGLGGGNTINFSTYEKDGFVYLQQTAHAPNASWWENIVAPTIASETWQEQARNLRQQLNVGSDGGPPLPGGETPEECWSTGVCG